MSLLIRNLTTKTPKFEEVICLFNQIPKQTIKIKRNFTLNYVSQKQIKPFINILTNYNNTNNNNLMNNKIINNQNEADGTRNFHILTNIKKTQNISLLRFSSSENNPNKSDKTEETQLTRGQKLKKAVAEYGSTVIVFHITISLISLGLCYLLVSSGLDVSSVLDYFNIKISEDNASKMASNAGTFVIAYAIHKVFVPVRMGITLSATPFIVRYLRKIGFLKKK